jgi:hypothetical protein
MAFTEDAITFVDTGGVEYPQLYQQVIELTEPALKLKPLLIEDPIVVGRTANYIKELGARAVAIGRTAEGAEIPMDFTRQSYFTVTPYKVALRERISREMLEDVRPMIIQSQLRRLARRMAYTIDKDVEGVIAAGATAANTFATTGTTIAYTGASISIASTIGVNDITQAKYLLEASNVIADSFALNPLGANDLSRLPQFASQDIFGKSVYSEGLGWEKGATDGVFGLKFYITPVVTAGQAYILSTGANLSAAYAPLGFFALKRPLMVDVDFKKEYDSFDVVASMRYAPVITYGESIVKITSLRTS